MAGAGSLVGIGAAVVLVAVVLGPGSRRPSVAPTSTATVTPGATATPTATRGQTLTATQDGLSLTASLDRTSVEPGGKVTIDVTIHNGRTTWVTYFALCDGAVEMNTTLPLPLEPAGVTWTGIEADLKAAALGKGSVPEDSNDAMPTAIYSVSCLADHLQRTLGPGETMKSALVWPAEIVGGLPALPGDVPFTIALMGPPAYPPAYSGHIGAATGIMVPIGNQLHVAGDIHIVGQAPKLLSKGKVVDAALADPTFAKWLAEQPESTWSGVNLGLENDPAKGSIPEPRWNLIVFRGQPEHRNWAMAFVDPFSGAVGLSFCDATTTYKLPC
jgi:hypothetical protein